MWGNSSRFLPYGLGPTMMSSLEPQDVQDAGQVGAGAQREQKGACILLSVTRPSGPSGPSGPPALSSDIPGMHLPPYRSRWWALRSSSTGPEPPWEWHQVPPVTFMVSRAGMTVTQSHIILLGSLQDGGKRTSLGVRQT